MPNNAGYIYAIQAEGTPYVKIGRTITTVEARLKALQTGHPLPLTVLAAIKIDTGLVEIERQLHTLLAAQQRTGEWFELTLDASQFLLLVEEAKQRPIDSVTGRRKALSPTPPHALGRNIDHLRQQRHWTWTELGRRARMHPQTIYKIVHTQGIDPRVSALARMALAFEVSLSELAGPLEDLLPQRADEDDAHAA